MDILEISVSVYSIEIKGTATLNRLSIVRLITHGRKETTETIQKIKGGKRLGWTKKKVQSRFMLDWHGAAAFKSLTHP